MTKKFRPEAGSTKANGREPKTCLSRLFHFKFGCFNDVHGLMYADARPHLLLKTRPRFSPVSLSLTMLMLIFQTYNSLSAIKIFRPLNPGSN